jgi:hypothetical protein
MPKLNKDEYKKGDESECGSIIGDILGATHDIIVFLTSNGTLAWENNDKYHNSHFSELLEIFDREKARIKAIVPREKYRHQFRAQLGSAFYNCVRDPSDTSAVHRLRRQVMDLEADLGFYSRTRYLILSFIESAFFGVMLICLLCVDHSHADLWLALAGGVLGVFLSIIFSLQRVRAIGKSTIIQQHFVDSLMRVIFGCLCGLVAYIFSKAGVAGSFFTSTDYGTMTFSIIAGFSERLIPSIITNLEKKSD